MKSLVRLIFHSPSVETKVWLVTGGWGSTLGLGPPAPTILGGTCSFRAAYRGKSWRMASWKSAGSAVLMERMVGNRSWQMTSMRGLRAYW